jgi:hypothetical protein
LITLSAVLRDFIDQIRLLFSFLYVDIVLHKDQKHNRHHLIFDREFLCEYFKNGFILGLMRCLITCRSETYDSEYDKQVNLKIEKRKSLPFILLDLFKNSLQASIVLLENYRVSCTLTNFLQKW